MCSYPPSASRSRSQSAFQCQIFTVLPLSPILGLKGVSGDIFTIPSGNIRPTASLNCSCLIALSFLVASLHCIPKKIFSPLWIALTLTSGTEPPPFGNDRSCICKLTVYDFAFARASAAPSKSVLTNLTVSPSSVGMFSSTVASCSRLCEKTSPLLR